MFRCPSRTTIKSKMELFVMKDNGQSLTIVTEGPTPDSTRVLDPPPVFLKIV